MVVENGLGASDTLEADGTVHDPYRIAYVKAHVQAMEAAMADGVDLRGYTPWGCIDLVQRWHWYAQALPQGFFLLVQKVHRHKWRGSDLKCFSPHLCVR